MVSGGNPQVMLFPFMVVHPSTGETVVVVSAPAERRPYGLTFATSFLALCILAITLAAAYIFPSAA
jgi:hypothetical protein